MSDQCSVSSPGPSESPSPSGRRRSGIAASAHLGQIARWPQSFSHPKQRLRKPASFHAVLRPHIEAGSFASTAGCLSASLRSDVNPARVRGQVFSSSAGLLFYNSLSALSSSGRNWEPSQARRWTLLPSLAVGFRRCFHLKPRPSGWTRLLRCNRNSAAAFGAAIHPVRAKRFLSEKSGVNVAA